MFLIFFFDKDRTGLAYTTNWEIWPLWFVLLKQWITNGVLLSNKSVLISWEIVKDSFISGGIIYVLRKETTTIVEEFIPIYLEMRRNYYVYIKGLIEPTSNFLWVVFKYYKPEDRWITLCFKKWA